MDSTTQRQSILSVAAGFIIFLALVYILREMASWLQPLFIALFLYYVSTPLIQFLQAHHFSERWAQTVVFCAMAVLIIGLGWIFGSNIGIIAEELPAIQKGLQQLSLDVSREFSGIPFLQKEIRNALGSSNLIAPPDEMVRVFFSRSSDFLSGSFLVLFFLIFIAAEAKSLPAHLKRSVGAEHARRIMFITGQINRDIIQYLYVKFLASLIIAGITFVLLMAFRVPLPALWAGLIFVTNFIPYVGSIFATMVIGIVGLLTLKSWVLALILVLILTACDMVIGNYWEPKAAGYRLDLSPLLLLVSLCFWGWLWGVTGLILAVPIMVLIRYTLENLPLTRPLGLLMSYEKRKHIEASQEMTEPRLHEGLPIGSTERRYSNRTV